jgi:hypothetical protein
VITWGVGVVWALEAAETPREGASVVRTSAPRAVDQTVYASIRKTTRSSHEPRHGGFGGEMARRSPRRVRVADAPVKRR